MSISSEINRIAQNVSDSLTAVASKGATVPSGANSDDLPDLISSLPSTNSVTYNLTGGASASVNPSKAITGQGLSLKLTAPTGYVLSGVTVTMGGTDITSQVFTPDEAGGGGGSYKTKTGTFVGSGERTQTIACDFEPDVIWIHGTTDQASIRAMETFIVIRDTASYLRYYSSTSNTTSFSYTLKNGITGLDPDSTTSYSMQTTYANGNVSIYAYTAQNRYYFNSAITYSYKFIKYTS